MPETSFHPARTMLALELLAVNGGRSAPELSEGLGAHPRTVRRVVQRLAVEGYVQLSGDRRRRWVPTMRLVALAAQVLAHSTLVQEARSYVTALHAVVGEDAGLYLPSLRSVVCVLHHTDQSPNGCEAHIGRLLPAHASAPGKCLLAWRTPWRKAVLAGALPSYTSRTLVGVKYLTRQLTLDREQRGYSAERGEHQVGWHAVAVPVRDRTGEVLAALAITAPAERLPEERFPEVAATLKEAAAALSDDLGYSPSAESTESATLLGSGRDSRAERG